MDQRAYLTKVDSALEGARKTVVAFVDHGIDLIRNELQQQQHGRADSMQFADPASFLKWIHTCRVKRTEFMPARIFADPAWDILIELTLAQLEHREVTVKVVQSAAMVPPATTLRWLHVLEDEGLVLRRHDPIDRRRTIVTLSEKGYEAMSKWLEGVMP